VPEMSSVQPFKCTTHKHTLPPPSVASTERHIIVAKQASGARLVKDGLRPQRTTGQVGILCKPTLW
jgi:hypothetical protein